MQPANIEIGHTKGFGDTVANTLHTLGIDKLSQMYEEMTGKPCNCKSRQEALNKLIPYKTKELTNELE